jgi:hypothetical protein
MEDKQETIKCSECPDYSRCPMADSEYTKDGCLFVEYQ